ncbi:MAG TPA: hypothetical protein VL651_16945 [Bacteroidia bacterium]|nr:hypothetical protein [Bacteroidia bacterium]
MNKNLRCILFLFLLPFATHLYAQRDTSAYDDDNSDREWGAAVYVQASHVFYHAHFADLQIQFPYRIDNRSGYFTGNVSGLGKGAGTFIAFGLQIQHRDVSFDMNISPFVTAGANNMFDTYIGLSWRCHYERYVPTMADYGTTLLCLPISFSLGIQDYNAIYNAGRIRIDTTERFYAFGSDLGLGENEPEHGFVNIYCTQFTLALTPTVNLGYRPLLGNFVCEFRFGPFIPILNKAGVNFYYRDSDFDNGAVFPKLATIPFKGYGIRASYNGGDVPNNPFPIAGWMLSFRVNFGTPELDHGRPVIRGVN